MNVEYFEIADRFRGPPKSGNGGYVCGRIAKHLRGTVSVRLRAPPPLSTQVRLETTDTAAQLFHGSTLIGEAKQTDLEVEALQCPSYSEAEQAAESYLGFKTHSFPGCFVCGPARLAGDGLRIFPGASVNSRVIAAPWLPDQSLADEDGQVKSEFLWSALDCPSGFAVLPLPAGLAIVLGELCASIVREVSVGERCVVTAWPLSVEGRKRRAASAIYSETGEPIALARAVWIEVPQSEWNPA